MICGVRSAYYKTEKRRVGRARHKWLFDELHPHSLPLVSVIIPTHNRKDILLKRALPSVAAQTYPNIEVIVVCHGCTDGTYHEVVESPHITRGSVIGMKRNVHYPDTPKNRWLAGPVEPLNEGLKHINGEWIARIDDDDEWHPNHIDELLRYALLYDYEFVSSAYKVDRGNVSNVISDDGGDPPIGGTQTWLWRSYLKFMKWNPDCWRKDWNAVNDTDLAQRMRDAGVLIGHLNKVTCTIRHRPGEVEIGLAAYTKSA
jgi:glycosyltransferase involved in cell wall biosynthesis